MHVLRTYWLAQRKCDVIGAGVVVAIRSLAAQLKQAEHAQSICDEMEFTRFIKEIDDLFPIGLSARIQVADFTTSPGTCLIICALKRDSEK